MAARQDGANLKEDLCNVARELGIVIGPEPDIALSTDSSSVDARKRLMSDDPIDTYMVANELTTLFIWTAVIRDAALKAHSKSPDMAALQRAALGRLRIPPKKQVVEGDVVYVWSNNHKRDIGGCVGPDLVVCINPSHSSVWACMRGELVSAMCIVLVQLLTRSRWALRSSVSCRLTPTTDLRT
eukprot:2972805-Karenia_brevis.AAC.1